MSRRKPRRPKLDPRADERPRAERPPSFYADQFTAQEMALLAASAADPALDDEIWMTRVLNRRMLAYTRELEAEGGDLPLETLVKAAQALMAGTGRVARLLRDRQALSGSAADTLARLMAQALEDVFEELEIEP